MTQCLCVCVYLSVLNSQRAPKRLEVPILVWMLLYMALNKRFSPVSSTDLLQFIPVQQPAGGTNGATNLLSSVSQALEDC